MRALMIALGLSLVMVVLALGQATYGYQNKEPLPLDQLVSENLLAPPADHEGAPPETLIWEF